MRYLFPVYVAVGIFIVSPKAEAAVLINEVAWMGTVANANAEWIELANDGDSSVDLSGWHLVASTGSPSISLTGSIGAHDFFLLERTSDASVPAVTADQIYTGALTNSGATLTLTDAQGLITDQVVGGVNWAGIGGDNTTKETAQRTASGWVTAPSTPRASTAGVTSTPSSGGASSSTTSSTSTVESLSNGGTPVYMPIPTLRMVVSGSRYDLSKSKSLTVSSGADTVYSAVVYDHAGNVRNDATVSWSFGDGMRRVGASVFHAYFEPGEYVMIVRATTPDKGEVVMDVLVTVKLASLTISSVSEKGVSLTNHDSRVLDVSFWRLRAGEKEFIFPEDTLLRSGQTVLFSSKVIQLPLAHPAESSVVQLLYPNSDIADTYPRTHLQPSVSQESYKIIQAVDSITIAKNVQSHDEAVAAPAPATNMLAGAGAALSDDDPGLEPVADNSSDTLGRLFRSPWTLGFLGVIALAGSIFIFH